MHAKMVLSSMQAQAWFVFTEHSMALQLRQCVAGPGHASSSVAAEFNLCQRAVSLPHLYGEPRQVCAAAGQESTVSGSQLAADQMNSGVAGDGWQGQLRRPPHDLRAAEEGSRLEVIAGTPAVAQVDTGGSRHAHAAGGGGAGTCRAGQGQWVAAICAAAAPGQLLSSG